MIMSSYHIFEKFYDALTQNVDYGVRSAYLSDLFSQAGKPTGTVLDLACGTGETARYLTEKGYRVIGLDLSADMLTVATAKGIPDLTLLCADMTDFALPEPVDACCCTLDSLNHLPDLSAVKRCFQCVAEALVPDGVFIFDVNTVYKHREVLADNAFIFDQDGYFLAWDNELLDERRVRILLDFFVENGAHYDRFSEELTETAYTVGELTAALSDRFDVLGVYEELSDRPPQPDSERIYFVCKRKKEWKR